MINVLELTTYIFKTISQYMDGQTWGNTEIVWVKVHEHHKDPYWLVLMVMVRQNGKESLFRFYQHDMKMTDGKDMVHMHRIIDIDEQPIYNDIDPELSEVCELALRSFLL